MFASNGVETAAVKKGFELYDLKYWGSERNWCRSKYGYILKGKEEKEY